MTILDTNARSALMRTARGDRDRNTRHFGDLTVSVVDPWASGKEVR